jgi:hypothetical protein
MKKYGSELQTIQSAMRTIVSDVEDAKARLDAKREAAQTAAANAQSSADYDPTDAAARTAHEQNQQDARDAAGDVTTAKTALDEHLEAFDAQWELWDGEYDDALKAVNQATEGNVTDHWTDNVAGVVDVVLKVLTWVGVALAVAALVIGGPFIAAIAAIVGLIVLIGTVFLYFKGRRSGAEVAWAVVGVLPFGKLGKLFQSGKRMTGLKEFLKGPIMEIVTPLRRMRDLRGLGGNPALLASGGLSSRAASGLAGRIRADFSNFGGAGLRNIPLRIAGGSSRAYAVEFAETFAQYSAHHRNVMTPHLGALADVLSSGGNPVARSEKVVNITEFAIKRYRMVEGRYNDIVAWMQPDPVDAWRSELAR